MGAIAGLVLWLATLFSAIGALWALVTVFTSNGAWGAVVALWLLLTASTGWRTIKTLMATGEAAAPLNNPTMAVAMTVTAFLYLGVGVLLDPPTISAWWGLLTPVVFIITSVLLIFICGSLLNLVNKEGQTR